LLLACSRDGGSTKAPAAASPAAAAVQATPDATAATIASAAPSAGAAPPAASTQPGAAEPSADLAFAHVQKLAAEIGVRVSGTPEEHAAAEYIAGQLRGYGYQVEMQSFPAEAFIIRSVSLKLEDGRSITTQPLTMSKPGSATGSIIYAGLGKPSDF